MGNLTGSDAEHPASGEVAVSGQTLLFKNVQITEAPDAQVFLTKDQDKESGQLIGKLQGFDGDQSYEIPADVDPSEYNSIVLWCDEFSVPIGSANL